MTYQEAKALSFNVRWKTTVCSQQGEACWCRIVEPETPIIDDEGNEIYIVSSGALSSDYAQYIVELHNKNIEDGKKRNNI